MRLLGSVIFVLMCTIELFGAKVYWLQSTIEEGESATLVLSAQGESIKFPVISQIGDFPIISHQTRQSMEFLNGKVTKQLDQYLTFYPDKNITTSSYEVIVDGKKEATPPLSLTIQKGLVKIDNNETFLFEMKVSKTNPMQQEGVKLSFVFKRDKNENLVDMKFLKPKMEGFWLKEAEKDTPFVEGNYIVHTISYYIFPQKSGDITIPKAKIEIARQVMAKDIFANQIKWKSILSNEITLHVKPLEGTNILGNFTFDVSVDRQTIEPNSPLNMTIKITGEGNFDDIEPFKLEAKGATIFEDLPKIKTFMEGDKLKGEFIQKFSLTSLKDFVIEPIVLTYFDAQKQKLEQFKSEKIAIAVLGQTPMQTSIRSEIQEEKKEIEKTFQFDIFNLLLGFFLGICITLAFVLTYNKKINLPKFNLSERELLQKLLKYRGTNDEIDSLILQLEENIYGSAKHPINKRKVKTLLENLV